MWEYIKLWIAKGIGEFIFGLGIAVILLATYLSVGLYMSWKQSRRERREKERRETERHVRQVFEDSQKRTRY